MKRFCYIFLLLGLAVCAGACNGDEEFNSLPRKISTFVCQYWPDPDVESYTQPSEGKYVVILRGGPELTFDAAYTWTEIDGCGMPLPQVLLYDQLPSPLYRYVEATEQTNAVYRITRTPREYTLLMLNTELTYDVGTEAIHTEEPPFDE